MSELIKISGCDNAERIVDVIFIHGLKGDVHAAWQYDKGDPTTFWPAWLEEDVKNIGVWSLKYQITILKDKGKSIPLPTRAREVLDVLNSNYMDTTCPIVFVAHSFGGLLVKQMLRHAFDLGNSDWEKIAIQTLGIVFFATPHAGPGKANWLNYFHDLLQTTVTIDELEAHSEQLQDLNAWYRSNVEKYGIETHVYYEELPTHGLIIVDSTSADPGIEGVTPIPVPADHISICKPKSRKEIVYKGTKRFIEKRLKEAPANIQHHAHNFLLERFGHIRKNTKGFSYKINLTQAIERTSLKPAFLNGGIARKRLPI